MAKRPLGILVDIDGDAVRAWRLAAYLSQAELGRRAGRTTQSIGNIECGRSRQVTATTLMALAEALECDPSALRADWRPTSRRTSKAVA